jgi:hypothetical protein
VERQEYEDMARRMLEIVVRMDAAIDGQRTINERLTAAIEGFTARQDGINERLTQAIEGIEITQARIETILKRMVRGGDNGREV